MSDNYAVIHAHRRTYSVQLMCDALDVAPSGYYAAQQRPPSEHAVADDVLGRAVGMQFCASGETYGAPRVHADLKARGLHVAKKRVARLMQEDGLDARAPRRYVVTTDSAHAKPVGGAARARQIRVRWRVTGISRWGSTTAAQHDRFAE